jgi:hypothetical protein
VSDTIELQVKKQLIEETYMYLVGRVAFANRTDEGYYKQGLAQRHKAVLDRSLHEVPAFPDEEEV